MHYEFHETIKACLFESLNLKVKNYFETCRLNLTDISFLIKKMFSPIPIFLVTNKEATKLFSFVRSYF